MKFKKTLSNWLTNRFLLIIRNEENFAEKRTFSFNYAKLIVFGITFLIIVFVASFYLINTVLFSLNPEYNQIEMDKKTIILSAKVDSLEIEVQRKDAYIMNFNRLLTGENAKKYDDSLINPVSSPSKKDMNLDGLAPIDAQLRKEIEEEGTIANVSAKYTVDADKYFIKPADGVVIGKYDSKKGILGVDIATKSNETVKSIADGIVILSNYSDGGYVIAIQHKNSLISVFKNNAVLLKEAGEYVHGGDAIAVTGNKGDTVKRNALHFQLWQEGNPVNPEHFISF